MLAAKMLGIKLGKSVQESLAFETLKDVEGLLLPYLQRVPHTPTAEAHGLERGGLEMSSRAGDVRGVSCRSLSGRENTLAERQAITQGQLRVGCYPSASAPHTNSLTRLTSGGGDDVAVQDLQAREGPDLGRERGDGVVGVAVVQAQVRQRRGSPEVPEAFSELVPHTASRAHGGDLEMRSSRAAGRVRFAEGVVGAKGEHARGGKRSLKDN